MENCAGSGSPLSSLVSCCPGERLPSLPAEGILPVVQHPPPAPPGLGAICFMKHMASMQRKSEASFFQVGGDSLNSPGIGHRVFSKPLLQCFSPPSPGGFGQLHPQPDSAQAAPHPPSCSESCGKHPCGGRCYPRRSHRWLSGDWWCQVPSSPVATVGWPKCTQSLCSPGMLRHFTCPHSPMQCPPSPAQSHLEIWGSRVGHTSSPRIPRVLLHPQDASSQGGGGEQGEVAGSALGGSGPPGGLVSLHLSPSHPVLVVFQGGVGSPAVLEELRVRWCSRTCALGRGTCAFALQGVDSR